MRKHTHRYYRTEFRPSKKKIFRCSIPGCSHYIFAEFINGRISLCNRCDEPFELNAQNTKLKKPHCGNCSEVKVKKDSGIENLVDSLFRR